MNNRIQQVAIDETYQQINVLENSLAFYRGLVRNYTDKSNKLRLDGFTQEADSCLRLANKYTMIEQDAVKAIREFEGSLKPQPITLKEVEAIVERYWGHTCPMRHDDACTICEDYGVLVENHPEYEEALV